MTKPSTATEMAHASTGIRMKRCAPPTRRRAIAGTRRKVAPRLPANGYGNWLPSASTRRAKPQRSSRLRLAALPARLRNTWAREPDFSHAVKEAMDGCLACKSCSGQCPIKVDVPTFRAKFLEVYHGRYLRPLRDHLVGSLESMLPVLGKMRRLYNLVIDSPPGRAAMRAIGLVHTPKFSPHVDAAGIGGTRDCDRKPRNARGAHG